MKSIFDYINIDYTSFIGRKFDTVTLLEVIGSGGKGVVFSGFQDDLKRRVAVKLLPKLKARTEEIENFFAEAQIVAGLSHPNIIPIYKMGESDDVYFQVMHLVEGNNMSTIVQKKLKHPVKSRRYLPFETVFSLMIDMLDALQHAHEEAVIHRDIKPANILIETKRNRLFVADFGIATTPGMINSIHDNVIVGSPLYLSPEQARGDECDVTSDVYSAGITLLYILLGYVPAKRRSPEEILRLKIDAPDSFLEKDIQRLRPDIDDELMDIITKAVASEPKKRIASAEEFIGYLKAYQN
ncbi:MAG: serine/threonine protein kinase [Fibrobacterota bacterium]